MPDIELSMTPRLAEYIRSVSPKEPEVLERLRAETASLPDAQMQISPEQGQFFRFSFAPPVQNAVWKSVCLPGTAPSALRLPCLKMANLPLAT